jgi:hypothetical protein
MASDAGFFMNCDDANARDAKRARIAAHLKQEI